MRKSKNVSYQIDDKAAASEYKYINSIKNEQRGNRSPLSPQKDNMQY